MADACHSAGDHLGCDAAYFVAGVRRGFSFGQPAASTGRAIATMLAYFVPGGLALVSAAFDRHMLALGLLIAGFMLVILLDPSAARTSDAPRNFARLRGPQMAIAVASLAALLIRSLQQ